MSPCLNLMKYSIRLKPKAVRDIKALPERSQARILASIEKMSDGLHGDVKHLTDFTNEYRLRVGEFRILFEIEVRTIVIYRIRHRKDAYRK
jgi:mRNA interferase RelE/StbE